MNLWVMIYRAGWILLGVLLVIAVGAVFLPEIRQYHELQRKQEALAAENRLEEEMLSHLKKQQERLRNDPRFLEKIAREEFGLAKPGETVFKFIEDDPNRPTNRAPAPPRKR